MSDTQPAETTPEQLPLGRDAFGRAWSLDLTTGAVRTTTEVHPIPVEDNSTVIPPTALDAERIGRVLAEGGWRVEVDAPLVSVDTEVGSVMVSSHDDGRLVQFARIFTWRAGDEELTADERASHIDDLNRAAFVVRFEGNLDLPDQVFALFDLAIAGGLTRAQLLGAQRRFVRETLRALECADCEEVLQ